MRLHEWSENVVNVENHQVLKINCEFLSVIWIKWKQSVSSTTPCSSTFYSLFLSFFVLEIFIFKYDKFFIRHCASISKFKWFDQPWLYDNHLLMLMLNIKVISSLVYHVITVTSVQFLTIMGISYYHQQHQKLELGIRNCQ